MLPRRSIAALQSYARRWYSSFLIYIELQLFIQLCAWPLLAAWGLPLSPAGLLGNFLYAPFLTAFLFISSVLFVCELISVPHYPLCALLELITDTWTFILNTGDRSWLYTAAHPPIALAVSLPLLACFIMICKPLFSPYKRIVCFTMLFIVAGYLLPYYQSLQNIQLKIPYCKGELTLIRSSSQTVLIDYGIFGRTSSAPKNISFQVLPFLIKQGIRHLDHLIIVRPSARVFQSLAQLLEQFPVKTVHIPHWKGALSNQGWYSWQEILIYSQKYGISIMLITSSYCLDLQESILFIEVAHQPLKKNRLTYPNIKIRDRRSGSLRYGIIQAKRDHPREDVS